MYIEILQVNINLVDVAGSERLSSSDCGGQRQTRETTSINSSLSTLGRVFMALTNKAAIIGHLQLNRLYHTQHVMTIKLTHMLVLSVQTGNYIRSC